MLLSALAAGLLLLEISVLFAQQNQAPQTLEPGSSCLAQQCHASLTAQAVVHGPLAEGDDSCELCHASQPNQHAFTFPAAGAELCYNCHEGVTEGKHLHAPLTDKQAACTICHNPHASSNKMLLKSKTTSDLCVDCHDDFKPVVEDMSNSHHLLLEGKSCARCHNPHAADSQKLLLNDTQTLCLTCHLKDVKSADGQIIGNMQEVLAKDLHRHGLGQSLDCAACHQPHANKEYRFFRGPYPRTFYSPYTAEAYGLCFTCHDESLAQDPQSPQATAFRNGPLNLHYLHVNKKRRGRTCRTCHASHVSKSPHMLRESVPFGQWRIPINFTRTENGGSCASGCHRPKTYDRVNPVSYGVTTKAASIPQTPEPSTTSPQTEPAK